jgi:hypothetical protein
MGDVATAAVLSVDGNVVSMISAVIDAVAVAVADTDDDGMSTILVLLSTLFVNTVFLLVATDCVVAMNGRTVVVDVTLLLLLILLLLLDLDDAAAAADDVDVDVDTTGSL